MLNHVKRIFSWAVADRAYGLEQSPAVLVKPKQIIGEKRVRTRVLTNPELRAFWQACNGLSAAYGALFRFILLTGVRIGEASGAKWGEFDLREKIWRIPSERYKSEQRHLVMSDDAVAFSNRCHASRVAITYSPSMARPRSMVSQEPSRYWMRRRLQSFARTNPMPRCRISSCMICADIPRRFVGVEGGRARCGTRTRTWQARSCQDL